MQPPKELIQVLQPEITVRSVADGIYSVMSDSERNFHYDRISFWYDLVVGTRVYNAIMWGCSPAEYAAFACDAVKSNDSGMLLDAACGSLLFTADAYLYTRRTIVAFDQSIAMLKKGRDRLLKRAGALPDNIFLVQADLDNMPFLPNSFETVLCMSVLHQYERPVDMISGLEQLRTDSGHLFIMSLLMNSRTIGDLYLKALYASGEFVKPRSSEELRTLAETILQTEVNVSCKGNMGFIRA